jgi:NADPH-dependent 2,4-dienoyl-CoA reductase/sulfur reductase-like enzyme
MVGRVTNAGQIDQLLANGTADMVGMARALICDPELPNKIASDRAEDIRECIGCNQACIGHADKGGYSVSCIQNPSSGRELEYRSLVHTGMSRRIVVAGGGPAGMKVAAVAAERGHRVSLFERSATLGGQARLAQLLPSRAEFGGLITNLEREVRMHRVDVQLGTAVSRAFLDELQADIVVVATGARPRRPQLEGIDDARAVDAWSVLKDSSKIGQRVIIADWRCDWIGLGLAEKLAREGCSVRLACTGYMAGESIERRTRDRWIGDLHRVGVEIIPYMRLFGVGDDEVIFQHILSGGAVALAQFDSLVLALGHESDTDLEIELANYAGEIHFLGDCVAPRTAEEAVLDGLRIGSRL